MSESGHARMDAKTRGRWLESHPISSSRAFGSGEKKKLIKNEGARVVTTFYRYILDAQVQLTL